MLRILAHRGLWTSRPERNSLPACAEAFRQGFDVELDVRDHNGGLVVCHDVPQSGALPFDAVLQAWANAGGTRTIAINVKSDGLQALLGDALQRHRVETYFVFDMSIPDLVGYRRAGLRYFTRQSDLEPVPHCLEQAAGVWFDGFARDWDDLGTVLACAARGQDVALVSPELHGREHDDFWSRLRGALGTWPPQVRSRVWLCTDHPHACRAYFDAADQGNRI